MNAWTEAATRASALRETGHHAPVRVAVVGVGYWGPNLVRNLHDLRSAEVCAVCDTDPAALDKVARRWPSIPLTASLDDVLRHEAIEAVAIATPVATHYELARAALSAGKHVFVEKPLAPSTAEAEALLGLASEAGLVLMPGHTFLYSPPVTYIRELIASGELGEISFISMSRLNLGLHQPDVSVVWDLGSHDISILRYWLDEMPVRLSAMSRGCVIPDTPDVAFINLEFPSGAIVNVEISWLAPTKLRRTVIVGSRKMVVYDDTSNEAVRVFDSGITLPDPASFGEFQLSYRTGDIVVPTLPVAEPLRLEMNDFIKSVRTGTAPRADSRLGADVVRVAEAVDASLAADGTPVRLEPFAPA